MCSHLACICWYPTRAIYFDAMCHLVLCSVPTQSPALTSAGVEGGVDASVNMPSASVDVPSGSVDMPSGSLDVPSGSLDVPSGSLDVPSASVDMPSAGGISGDLPSVDAKLTGPDVDVEGGDTSLGAGLAAGLTAAVGATAVGLGLSGKADKPEGKVRAWACVCFVCLLYRLGRCFTGFRSKHLWVCFAFLYLQRRRRHSAKETPPLPGTVNSLDLKPRDARCCYQVPDVSLSAPDMPSGDVDVSVSAPDMPSGDVDASVSVPDMPSVDLKSPKKSLFGKFLKKKPGKASVEVSRHNMLPLYSLYRSFWLIFRRGLLAFQCYLYGLLLQGA